MAETRRDIFARARRVLVKVGSGVLTGENGLDLSVIENMVDDMASISRQGYQFVLVSSGAIASGKHRMGFANTSMTMPQKQAAAAIGQGRLMRIYNNAFGKHGMAVAQMLLTMSDLVDRKRFLNTRNTLSVLLEWGVVPVINENDTVSIEEIKFGDNDNLAAMMANIMAANVVINLTNTDGLYDRNPRETAAARRIPLVKEITEDIETMATSEADPVGMGGMKSKVIAAKKVTAFGIPYVIACGKEQGILTRIFAGDDVGTLFLPVPRHMTSKKHWIAFTLRSRGKIIVDDGASEAIVGQGKSLLPSGILRVEGDFAVGDPVTCFNEEGMAIAKGLVNYSAGDIERIKGLRTTRIEQVLGEKPYDEVIHRDNMAVSQERR